MGSMKRWYMSQKWPSSGWSCSLMAPGVASSLAVGSKGKRDARAERPGNISEYQSRRMTAATSRPPSSARRWSGARKGLR